MQSQHGTAAEAAILAKTRRFRAKLLIDWNGDGLFNHALSDMSNYASNITTDIQLAGSAPAEILLIEGSGAGQLTFTMAGVVSGQSLAATFSPYNDESVLATKAQVGAEVRYSIIVDGKNGSYELPQFVGNIRTISPDRATGQVTVTALDRVELLRKSIQLPAWAVSSKQLGWGQLEQMFCRSHWVIDNALRLCNVGAGPKRPAFHHELSGTPTDKEGPQFFATLNGGEIATVGRSMNAGSNSYPASTSMYVDTGPMHPSAPAGTQRPQGVVSVGLPLGQAATNPNDKGILRWFAEDIDGINAYASHYLGFTLNCNGNNPNLYQTIANHEVLEVLPGAKFKLVIDIQAGQVRTRFVNLNTNVTQTGAWVNIPTGQFNVDIFAMWDLTDETGSRSYMSAGANNTGWVTMGSAPALGGIDDNAGRITLGHALSVSDVFYSNRNYYGATIDPGNAYRTVAYPAVLDRGKNRLTHVPSAKPQEAWELIKNVAGAEMGSVFWDEQGIFRFWNFDTVSSKQNITVRQFDLDTISGFKMTNSLDSVRNEYAVLASKKRAVGLVPVYKSSDVDEFYVPGRTERIFRLWVDDVIAPWTLLMRKHSSDPLSGGSFPWVKWDDNTVIHGYCVQYLIGGLWQEVNARTGVDLITYFTREGFLTVRIWNGWNEPIRLARGAGDSSTASFILGGTKMEGSDGQTIWTRDEDSIDEFGARSLELKGDWYQDSISQLNLVKDLLTRTTNPIPATDAITIPGDPRLQLGDTIAINDPRGFGQNIKLQILGINRTFDRDTGLTDQLTVEMVQPGGPTVDPGDPDDGTGGGDGGTETPSIRRTNLMVDPMAANSGGGIGPGPVGSAYVTGLTDMVRSTGYRISGATTDGKWPVVKVVAGRTYRATVFVRPDGADMTGSAHITWYQADNTRIASTPVNAFNGTNGQVVRADTIAQVAPQNAALARLYVKSTAAFVMTGALFEETSELRDYFDADTPGASLNADGTSSIGGTSGSGGSVAGDPPGTIYNIAPFYLGLPTGSGTSASITQPALMTYVDSNFVLDDLGRMVMTAPVQGVTTSGSDSTRTEFREQIDGTNTGWDMDTTAARELVVSGTFDPTSIAGGSAINVMIIGQIHGASGTPPLYLTADYDNATPRIRLFKNGPGFADVLTGITPSDRITYKIRVANGRLQFYIVKGEVDDLPTTALYDWPVTDFSDRNECYFKFGAYNKQPVASGVTGACISTISYFRLTQDGILYEGTAQPSSGGGGTGGTGGNPTGPGTYSTPAQCLNLGQAAGKNKFNIGIGDATHGDKTLAQIESGYTEDDFKMSADGTQVEFRADMDDATTSGSGFPRSELRELALSGGTTLAAWDGGSDVHRMWGTSTGIHFHPTKAQKAVFAQIHDSGSDVMRVQWETTSGKLGIVVRNTPPGSSTETKTVVMTDYAVGTPVKWLIEVINGVGKLYLNDIMVRQFPCDTTGCYFKAGCYAQSNDSTDSASEYDVVALRDFGHWHTGWPDPAPPVSNGPSNPSGGGGSTGQNGTTAAQAHGWGDPDASSDVFNYVGLPNSTKWDVYGEGGTVGGDECWVGHDSNGRRCVKNVYSNGEYLRITGQANGDTTGVSHVKDQQYGRWEVRARFLAKTGATGNKYHPVLIVWPQSDLWPQDGEYDFVEVDIGDTNLEAFLHYPHPNLPVEQENPSKSGVDITQWHNYGFEWTSTGLKGYIDGVQWFNYSGGGGPNGRSNIQAMPSGHLTMQLDNFFGASGMQEGYMDVQWARVYTLNSGGTGGGGSTPSQTAVNQEKAFQITSTAENSTKDWTGAYDYIEDILDGRGYTGGIVGFTSATGDMLELVQDYVAKKPTGNGLSGYVDDLQATTDYGDTVADADYGVNGGGASTIANSRLGSAYRTAWAAAANGDSVFRQCQRDYRTRVYWTPAYNAAVADGVGPLGLALYYDTMVNHGPGVANSNDGSFQDIRSRTTGTKPINGGSESTWLKNFLSKRSAVLTTWGDNPADGRVKMFTDLINTGNFQLTTPFSWKVYGDTFTMSTNPTPVTD